MFNRICFSASRFYRSTPEIEILVIIDSLFAYLYLYKISTTINCRVVFNQIFRFASRFYSVHTKNWWNALVQAVVTNTRSTPSFVSIAVSISPKYIYHYSRSLPEKEKNDVHESLTIFLSCEDLSKPTPRYPTRIRLLSDRVGIFGQKQKYAFIMSSRVYTRKY